MTAKKKQVSFEDVLTLVLEGARLGILDDIDIGYKEQHIDFYYGGLYSDNYITMIWVEASGIVEHHKPRFIELKRKVKKAKGRLDGNRQKDIP